MSVDLALVVAIAVLVGCGTTLMLERSLSRILVGFVMVGNGVNLMFLVASGPSGSPPIVGRENLTDPLPQAMALTAIVITLGVCAFGLALAYRSWQLSGHDDVLDDIEDNLVRRRAELDETSSTFDAPEEEVPDEEGSDEETQHSRVDRPDPTEGPGTESDATPVDGTSHDGTNGHGDDEGGTR